MFMNKKVNKMIHLVNHGWIFFNNQWAWFLFTEIIIMVLEILLYWNASEKNYLLKDVFTSLSSYVKTINNHPNIKCSTYGIISI